MYTMRVTVEEEIGTVRVSATLHDSEDSGHQRLIATSVPRWIQPDSDAGDPFDALLTCLSRWTQVPDTPENRTKLWRVGGSRS